MTDLRPSKQNIDWITSKFMVAASAARSGPWHQPKFSVSTLGYACVVTFKITRFVALGKRSPGYA